MTQQEYDELRAMVDSAESCWHDDCAFVGIPRSTLEDWLNSKLTPCEICGEMKLKDSETAHVCFEGLNGEA